ncbi:unnamed protein product [Moneuplotes crassus]|uniref:Uncharacterized protein n=1 Tax=Euplotes crassus TaxID=5936 RepID=A0AAD1XMY1_EUPCR|nr:unnamed protein product [Moneuplotes crassus]
MCLCLCASIEAGPVKYPPMRRALPAPPKPIDTTFKTSLPTDAETIIEIIIGVILSEMRHLHIDRYEVEDGVLTNVDINFDFPTFSGVTFRGDLDSGEITFKLLGVKADIKADLNFYHGVIKGNTKIQIDKMDIELKSTPVFDKDWIYFNFKYHLHIKDTDISMNIDAIKGDGYYGGGMNPLLGNVNLNMVAIKMVDNELEKQTEKVLQSYFNSNLPQKDSSKDAGISSLEDLVSNTNSAIYKFGRDELPILTFESISEMPIKSRQRIREKLVHSDLKPVVTPEHTVIEAIKSRLTSVKHHVPISHHSERKFVN